MKNIIFTIAVFILLVSLNYAQNKNANTSMPEKYSLVKIYSSGQETADKMAAADLHIDHAIRKENYTEAWLSESEIESLKKAGVSFSIIINDWKKHYESFPKMSEAEMRDAIWQSYEADGISHSIYGSMGGFLKYSEVNAKLDSMRLQYPNLISTKFSIGTTIEGRTIWTVRVSNSPDAPSGRPEIWYHSLIHAREPESMEHIIYFMYWLFENYNIDPLATYILQNRELYFTPVLNPDGYVYNETTNPNGGGMWRKNRRNNGGSFGIDLNRNYGIFQYWNSGNGGSSTSPSSDTYRGTSPFSEPETQAARNFIVSRNIQAVMGSHTYGNYIIKPWAWQDPTPTPDDAKFNEYLADMSKYNGFKTGTPSQTVNYYVRGSADDWYYNDSSHSPHRIIAVTPEVGATGFWPTQAEIIPLAEGMLFPNQYFAMIGGAYVYPVSANLNKSVYSAGESGTIKIKFKNKGLQNAQNVKIECSSPSYYLNVPVTFYSYPGLNSFASDSSTFGFTISPAVPNNSAMPLVFNIKQNDSSIVYTETKYVLVGNGTITLADSAENGFTKWTTNQGWGITTSQSHTPTHSFTDSPTGNYSNNANNSMTLTASINAATLPVAYLSFWHRYSTEANYDFCYVEVSSNSGTSWQTVKSYNGSLTTWTQQVLDITSYANASSQLKIRFTLRSDAGVIGDGWYVDDIAVTNYSILNNAVVTNVNLILSPEAFLAQNNNLNMKDTLRLNLRKNISPYSVLDSSKSILDSVSLTANFGFTNTPAGVYYFIARHRNSIETWSKSGGEVFSFGGTINYDYTSAASQAFGNNMTLKGTKYCIYSGDVNQDGAVDGTDAQLIDNDAYNFSTGYISTDVNGDGNVDGTDALYAGNNAADFVTIVRP